MKSRTLAASIWIHLAKCYGRVLQRVRRIESRAALTLPQFDAVAQLLRRPEGMTAGELSRELLVTAGNVTGIVARLRARGLVSRTADPEDGRAAVLRLTPKGVRVARTEVDRHVHRLTPVFDGLSVADRGRIRRALQTLLQSLEKGGIE